MRLGRITGKVINWKVLVSVGVFLLLLGACSSRTIDPSGQDQRPQASPTAAATPLSSPTTPPQSTDVEAPEAMAPGSRIDGGTLVRLGTDPPTLDPHMTTDATSATYIVEVFGGLVTIDQDLNIVPDLAESMPEVSPDGRVYTFRIRRDAKFHDGKPVMAQDFKWSIERVANPLTGSPVVDQYLGDIVGVKERLAADATEVTGVRVIDDRTLEITIDAPKTYFLAKLTYPTAFVLDRENVETGRRWFRTPNGTGPFKLAEYVSGERLTLSRNENYHLGPPFLEKARFILSGGTGMLMYENDEIQITGVGVADLDRVLDLTNSLNAQLQKAPPSFSTDYIGMNVDRPPFKDDPKLRQALNYAIDKQVIARDVLAGLVVPATGILPPEFPGYTSDIRGYDYDPVKAAQLLKESNYGAAIERGDAPPIIMTTAGSFGSSVGLDLEVILEMWRQTLGIEVEVLQTEFATYLQDLNKRRFEMFQIGWIADYPDPENFLDILFHSESGNNHTGYSNPEVDRLLEQARTEPIEDVRFELYNRAERLILQDAPWIPLWYSGDRFVLVKPYVHDYQLTPLIIPRLRFVYMTEK